MSELFFFILSLLPSAVRGAGSFQPPVNFLVKAAGSVSARPFFQKQEGAESSEDEVLLIATNICEDDVSMSSS
jgi:hypothetical protein